MIFFPNAKINIGLDVIARRPDGYHDIETVMYPVAELCDVLEIVPANGAGAEFSSSGLALDCTPEQNLCLRACRLMAEKYGTGGVKIRLHKIIPSGAGLGGGSSDAAFVIKGIDRVFGLGLPEGEMESLAAQLGSDAPFFIRDTAQMARGRGEILTPVEVGQLAGKRLVVVKPPVHVSTAEAYAGITPEKPAAPLTGRIELPVENWQGEIVNAFEGHILKSYPQIAATKVALYSQGAVYASMTGSGSAVFGIFPSERAIDLRPFTGMFVYQHLIG